MRLRNLLIKLFFLIAVQPLSAQISLGEQSVYDYNKPKEYYIGGMTVSGVKYLDGNVLIIDLREVPENLSGNRFIEYALFPATNVSVRVIWGREKKNMVLTVGHSILERTCKADIGSLMLKHGGGGHQQVGTCQVDATVADQTLEAVIAALKER